MEAYNLKELLEILKSKGLIVAEEGAKQSVESILEWLLISAQKSENKYDDLLSLVIPAVKPQIMAALEKIDGQ